MFSRLKGLFALQNWRAHSPRNNPVIQATASDPPHACLMHGCNSGHDMHTTQPTHSQKITTKGSVHPIAMALTQRKTASTDRLANTLQQTRYHR